MRIPTIKRQILLKFQKTANAIAKESENIITKSFDTFYASGSPIVYQRAHILPQAKKVESNIGETQATITAGYEAGQLGYTQPRQWTADGHVVGGTGSFSSQEVLDATMSGSDGVLGNSSYDDVALQKVVEMADRKMASAFG